MRAELIRWCKENGERQMLDDGGDLVKGPHAEKYRRLEIVKVYGRRYY